MKRHFTGEDRLKASKQMKRSVIRQMQIKATARYDYTPTRMA